MTSHFANLFTLLRNKLDSLQDTQEVPQKYFRFLDQDFGQLEVDRPPVTWPCVLIDIDNTPFTDLSQNLQQGTVTVILRLGFPPFSSGSSITPSPQQDKALYFYDLEQVIYLALQGKKPIDWLAVDSSDEMKASAASFSAFDRVNVRTEAREGLIRVRVLTYTIGLQDNSAKPTTIFTPAALDLNAGFDLPA